MCSGRSPASASLFKAATVCAGATKAIVPTPSGLPVPAPATPATPGKERDKGNETPFPRFPGITISRRPHDDNVADPHEEGPNMIGKQITQVADGLPCALITSLRQLEGYA